MPVILQIPGAGRFSNTQPLAQAAVGWADAPMLGVDLTITTTVAFSSPILVAGYDAFMIVMEVEDDTVDVYVAICDPTDNSQLYVTLVINSLPPFVPGIAEFGRASDASISGEVTEYDWHVIQIGLLAQTIGAQIVSFDFFAGTR